MSRRVSPLDDEDLLQEILLRLPPLPSTLPRASLVCTRWRSILSDPHFLGRYRKHHGEPPLLGFFKGSVVAEPVFAPVLDSPDRIPAARFSAPEGSERWRFHGCRHGLAVMLSHYLCEVVVWDPLTGQQHRVPFPPVLRGAKRRSCSICSATALCADAKDGHVHGDCFSSPFKLVLICSGRDRQTFACIYESTSGVWGNIVSMTSTDMVVLMRPCILIGNAGYWSFYGGDILEFDFNRKVLAVIEKPADAHCTDCWSFQPIRTEDDGGLGLAVMSELSIHLWARKLNSDGAVQWVLLQKIIQLEGLFPQRMFRDFKKAAIVGYDEDSNVVVLSTYIGDFMLQLESMRFTIISIRRSWNSQIHYPYRNFYTAGRAVGVLGGNGWIRNSEHMRSANVLCWLNM